MEELTKQVKGEMLRTMMWAIVAMGIAIGIHYLFW